MCCLIFVREDTSSSTKRIGDLTVCSFQAFCPLPPVMPVNVWSDMQTWHEGKLTVISFLREHDVPECKLYIKKWKQSPSLYILCCLTFYNLFLFFNCLRQILKTLQFQFISLKKVTCDREKYKFIFKVNLYSSINSSFAFKAHI